MPAVKSMEAAAAFTGISQVMALLSFSGWETSPLAVGIDFACGVGTDIIFRTATEATGVVETFTITGPVTDVRGCDWTTNGVGGAAETAKEPNGLYGGAKLDATGECSGDDSARTA